MRGKTVLIFSTIYCLASQAVPHGVEHHDDEVARPNAHQPVDPTIAYIPPKDDVKAHHSDMDMNMDMDMDDMEGMDPPHHHNNTIVEGSISPDQMSYWLWPEHRGLLYAHITIMTISWGFVLPVGMC